MSACGNVVSVDGPERGSASVLVIGVVAVAIVATLVVGDIAIYLRGRAEAMAAADAAALAAAPVTFHAFGSVGGPTTEASRFAAANGARLERCDCPVDRTWRPRTVEVVVSIPVSLMLAGTRVVAASSAAEFDPVRLAAVPRPASGP